jgi:hypothetical protein
MLEETEEKTGNREIPCLDVPENGGIVFWYVDNGIDSILKTHFQKKEKVKRCSEKFSHSSWFWLIW